MRTLCLAVFHTKTEKKKTSKFSFCVWGLRKSWDFHKIEEKKQKFTGHAYFRGQIILSHRIVTSQITPFCKIHGASHVSFGLSRVTRDTLPSSDKIVPLWYVADGRKRYSQRTSKSGESRIVMTEPRCWIRKEMRISSSIIKYPQSREWNILSLQISLSNYAKCN